MIKSVYLFMVVYELLLSLYMYVYCFSLGVGEAPVGMKLSGTYQVLPGDGSAGDDGDDPAVTEHAPLPELTDDNSNSVKCEENNQHENDIVNTNPNLESMLLIIIKWLSWLQSVHYATKICEFDFHP